MSTDELPPALVAVERSSGPVDWFVLNAEVNVEVDRAAPGASRQRRVR
jgi:hypothetical protein